MAKIKEFLPEGSNRARIRATSRVSKSLEDGTIGETLGEEARGLVVLDFEGDVFYLIRMHPPLISTITNLQITSH